MNTKETRFLAVLAVIALAFASFAVISAEENDAAEVDYKTVPIKANITNSNGEDIWYTYNQSKGVAAYDSYNVTSVAMDGYMDVTVTIDGLVAEKKSNGNGGYSYQYFQGIAFDPSLNEGYADTYYVKYKFANTQEDLSEAVYSDVGVGDSIPTAESETGDGGEKVTGFAWYPTAATKEKWLQVAWSPNSSGSSLIEEVYHIVFNSTCVAPLESTAEAGQVSSTTSTIAANMAYYISSSSEITLPAAEGAHNTFFVSKGATVTVKNPSGASGYAISAFIPVNKVDTSKKLVYFDGTYTNGHDWQYGNSATTDGQAWTYTAITSVGADTKYGSKAVSCEANDQYTIVYNSSKATWVLGAVVDNPTDLDIYNDTSTSGTWTSVNFQGAYTLTATAALTATINNSGSTTALTLSKFVGSLAEDDSGDLSVVTWTSGSITLTEGSVGLISAPSGCSFILSNGVNLTLSQDLALDITLGTGSVITINEDYTYEGAVSYTYTDTNGDEQTDSAEMKIKAGDSSGVTITQGSIKIKGTVDGTAAASYVTGTSGSVKLDAVTIDAGNFTLGGTLEVVDDLTVSGNATVITAEKSTITIDDEKNITVSAGSTMTVSGTVNGDGEIVNNGTVKQSSTGKVSVEVANKAIIDEDDMSEINVDGESDVGSTSFPAKQTVNVNGSWELIQDSEVTINGKLIVPVGAVMTIDAGAKLILASDAKFEIYGTLIVSESVTEGVNDGKIEVNSGSMIIYGEVNSNGAISVATDQTVTVAEGGLFIIQTDGSITNSNSDLVVEKDAELRIFGLFDAATIQNYGSVLIDSESPAQGVSTVYQMGDGAVVDVRQYTIDANKVATAKLIISDDGMHLFTYRDPDTKLPAYVTVPDYDQIVVEMNLSNVPVSTGLYSVSFSNIYVSSAVSSTTSNTEKDVTHGIYNYKLYSKTMDLYGTLDVDYTYIGEATGSTDLTATATLKTSGKFLKISQATYVSDNVLFENSGTIKVTGPVETQSKDARITNTGTLTLADDGIISCMGAVINNTGTINAAKYTVQVSDAAGKTTKMYVYTTIDTALAYINLSDSVHETEVVGTQTVTESAFLRNGKTLVATGTLNIGKSNGSDVILDVYDGAIVKGAGTINVNGTLFAENKSNIRDKKIISDVYSEETDSSGKAVKNGWARWTNLASAIANSSPGDIIVIDKETDAVFLNSNLTIPSDRTVVLPSTSIGLLIKNGVTLTINGLLQAEAPIWAEQAFDLTAQKVKIVDGNTSRYSSAIVVNGALTTDYAVGYADGQYSRTAPVTATSDYTKFTSKVLLSAGAPIAGAYFTTDDYNVIAGFDVAIDNIDEIQSKITLNGEVIVELIGAKATEDCEEIIVNNLGKKYGVLKETAAGGTVIEDSLTVGIMVLDGMKLTVKGEINGIVSIGDDSVKFVGANKTGLAAAQEMVIEEDSKAKHMQISGTVNIADKGDSISITSGTVLVKNLTVTQATSGVGGLNYTTYVNVEEEAILQSNDSNASVFVNLNVYGIFNVPSGMAATVTNLVNLGAISIADASSTTSEGTLTVNGDFYIGMTSADHIAVGAIAVVDGVATFGNNTVIYLLALSSIDDDLMEKLEKLNKTEFYVEGELWFTAYATGANKTIVVSEVPVDNAALDDWVDIDGVVVESEDVLVDFKFTIGANEALFAKLDYNLYSIRIIADQGIQNVSIDGKLLVSDATGTDSFRTATPIVAGTHEIKYELKKGYEGSATLTLQSSDSDASVSGLKLTVSGDAGITYLQLKGVAEEPDQPAPTPEEKSEWTITTILLCVLVVLIAIMAVIVALRLNRN